MVQSLTLNSFIDFKLKQTNKQANSFHNPRCFPASEARHFLSKLLLLVSVPRFSKTLVSGWLVLVSPLEASAPHHENAVFTPSGHSITHRHVHTHALFLCPLMPQYTLHTETCARVRVPGITVLKGPHSAPHAVMLLSVQLTAFSKLSNCLLLLWIPCSSLIHP